MTTFRSAPEYRDIPALVAHLLDDDRTEFSHEDLVALNYRLRRPVAQIRRELEDWGLRLAAREVPRHVRGFTTSSNDRWFGPGSEKTHGGAALNEFPG
jgi:hypothetical protein